MEIKGKVYLMFEQSGTFKNEFKKLGFEAIDIDIQNNFNETDYVMDLFNEIEKAHNGMSSFFDGITHEDLIIGFFPCIYFTGSVNPCYFTLENYNYKSLSLDEKIDKILERAKNRESFYEILIKFVGICLKKNIRLVIENPYSTQHFLCNNFFKSPDVFDKNRMIRGDYFKKPTGYWFFNCNPTYGESYQMNKESKKVWKCKSGVKAGVCSEERSLLSPDYARNFICDFIIGKNQKVEQLNLF